MINLSKWDKHCLLHARRLKEPGGHVYGLPVVGFFGNEVNGIRSYIDNETGLSQSSMVAVSSPAKVLVTGANGYLAVWVVSKYLEAGYSVRGTVRSLAKSAFLNDQFAHYGDRFELVAIEDITKDGAFDDAVRGVDAIAHTASPFHYKATHPDGTFLYSIYGPPSIVNWVYAELIIPAVRGTTSILNSALKHGNTVKRFILTSSVAAIREETTTPRVFNETNWNNAAVEAVNAKGSDAGPVVIYLASKTLAEKAAWEFVATHKSEISWDLVAINPPYIFGVDFISLRLFS